MKKILRNHFRNVIYSDEDWHILFEKRNIAKKLLLMFDKEGLNPIIHGSVARGDTHEGSDIDLVFTNIIPSFQIEYILHKNGFNNYFREIIMATPRDPIKLYIYLSELETITVPLTKLEQNNLEFYNFGGKIRLDQLIKNVRVSGINKKLVLIKPTLHGHEEISIIDNEALVAKEVGISIKTINERKKILLKREKYGRTGVFLKRKLQINETTEEVLKRLANLKSIVRKKLYKK